MKVQIKNRYSGSVLFEAEQPDDMASGMALRHTLEKAVASKADLGGADLRGADLRGADLGGADLRGAYLRGAYLRGADLGDVEKIDPSVLRQFRDDIWAVLSSAPREAAGVLAALRAGKVDGTTYTGDCACLVGTIAKTRACNYQELGALKPDSGRAAEQWFMLIKPGQTPENHGPAKLAAAWVEEWIVSMQGAFGTLSA